MTKILLVEDEILLSFSTAIALEDAGHQVLVAYDGQEGLELANIEQPDVVVADLMMPRMTGLEMISALRGSGFAGGVILATSTPESGLPSHAQYDAYLPKPYSEATLCQVIQSVILMAGRRRSFR